VRAFGSANVPAPAAWAEVSGQVDHVLQVVPVAQPGHRSADQGVDLGRAQAHGPTHTGVQVGKLRHADQAHTFKKIGSAFLAP
jgi:hypothetical protein